MERAKAEEQKVTHCQYRSPVIPTAVEPNAIVKIAQGSAQNQSQCNCEPKTAGGGETEKPHGNADHGRHTQPGKQPRIILPQSPECATIETGQKPELHPAVDIGDAFSLPRARKGRSEEHTSELQSPVHLVCR